MNFIMIGLLLREALDDWTLDRLCVRLNMYLVERTISPTLCSLKASDLLPGERGEIWGM